MFKTKRFLKPNILLTELNLLNQYFNGYFYFYFFNLCTLSVYWVFFCHDINYLSILYDIYLEYEWYENQSLKVNIHYNTPTFKCLYIPGKLSLPLSYSYCKIAISIYFYAERERGQWSVYYTSPQSFVITISYLLS